MTNVVAHKTKQNCEKIRYQNVLFNIVIISSSAPSPAPENVTGVNSSSTSIRMRWNPVPEEHNKANGKVILTLQYDKAISNMYYHLVTRAALESSPYPTWAI